MFWNYKSSTYTACVHCSTVHTVSLCTRLFTLCSVSPRLQLPPVPGPVCPADGNVVVGPLQQLLLLLVLVVEGPVNHQQNHLVRVLHSKELVSKNIYPTETASPCRLKLSCLTQPLPACSVGSYTDRQVVQYTVEQGGRGWVMQLFLRRRGSGVRSQ